MRLSLLLSLLLACSAAHAQTYRWVDPAGRTQISDTPPPGKQRAQISDAAATPADNLPYAVRKAAEAFPVVLYTTPDCGDLCKQAREQLGRRGVPYTEKTVQTPETQAELKQLLGDLFVPAIKVGSQKARGFEAGLYDNLLDLAGYPKSAPYRAAPEATAKP